MSCWQWVVAMALAQDEPPASPTEDVAPVEVATTPEPSATDPETYGDEAAPDAPDPDAPEPGPPARPALELTGMGRRSYDVVVFVRYDGNLYYGDELVIASDLERLLREDVARNPDTRVVITGDTLAPYDALVRVVVLARAAGAERTALEVLAPELTLDDHGYDDPLFPNQGGVVLLDEGGPDSDALRVLKPKRHKFPQDPYANTASYTAYTLEWGESKIGLGSLTTGVAPRVQLGAVPVLYFAGVFNANLKANLIREGPFDAAVVMQYYNVPLTGIASRWLGGDAGDNVAVNASYLGIGATGSLQVARPWSVHLQTYWARPSINGEIMFADLPEVLLPGLSLGGSGAVGLGVIGDVGIVNLATDLRFNRRDSVFAWLRYPFYGRVRGRTNGEIGGFEELSNADFIVAYGDWIPFGDSYSVALGYAASWKHFEARVGIGFSAVPSTWLLQAFELSYRFGGATRRQERKIRRGYRKMPGDALPAEE
jgi:hypothetical protein